MVRSVDLKKSRDKSLTALSFQAESDPGCPPDVA